MVNLLQVVTLGVVAVTHPHLHLPRHLATEDQKVKWLLARIRYKEEQVALMQNYISSLQRQVSFSNSEALSEQLEVNRILTERVLELEEKLDAIKQCDN